MHVILNGEKRTLVKKDCSLAEALHEWGYQTDMPIAVAVNHQLIPKQQHAKHILTVGNIIEILMPMQGG